MTCQERLTWRMDPDESMSDWTIEVASLTNGVPESVVVYHVHQNILGVGSRKSNFFLKLFRSEFFETKMKICRLEFEEEVVDAFPILLDYMYFPERKLAATVENLPSLMKLADYLDIPSIHEDVASYCHQNLSLKTYLIFYGYAMDYKIMSLEKAAVDLCYENFLNICPDSSSIASDSGITLWLSLRKCIPDDNKEYLLHLSRHIAVFSYAHKEELQLEEFHHLTNQATLPHIHYKAAKDLIQIELQFAKPDATKLSDLLERCVDSLADAWRKHTYSIDQMVCFGPLVLSTLVQKITENAKNDLSIINEVIVRDKNNYRPGFAAMNDSGLDLAAVTGVYSIDQCSSYGRNCFFKKGQWQGKQGTFYLYFEQQNWHIAIVVEGSEQVLPLNVLSQLDIGMKAVDNVGFGRGGRGGFGRGGRVGFGRGNRGGSRRGGRGWCRQNRN